MEVNIFFIGDSWVKAAIQFKESIVGAGIFRIIIGEFRYRQEPSPVILLVVNKGLKVAFHIAVLFLCLNVYLEVESGRKSPFYVKK